MGQADSSDFPPVESGRNITRIRSKIINVHGLMFTMSEVKGILSIIETDLHSSVQPTAAAAAATELLLLQMQNETEYRNALVQLQVAGGKITAWHSTKHDMACLQETYYRLYFESATDLKKNKIRKSISCHVFLERKFILSLSVPPAE